MNTEGVISVAKKELTAKEKKICQFIADGENQTQAAILAGYSKENAASIASKTIKKPKVQAYLAEIEKEICRNIGLSPELIGGRLEKQYQAAVKSGRTNATFKAVDRMITVYKLQQQFGTADSKIEISVTIDET